MKNAALITGGAKRIGREMAIYLAELGFDIAINYNNSATEAQNLAEEISQKFNVKCKIFQADLSDVENAKKLANQVADEFPNWNLLINNASIFTKSKFLDEQDSNLSDNLNVHFLSPFFLSKIFAEKISATEVKNAQIINMVDKNIMRYETQYFHYTLTKKFLAELTKMLSLELAPRIRVNGIAPGFILNGVHEKNPIEETEKLIKKIPLKKKGEVENILQTVNFLLQNDFVSGQILFVDGAADLNHAG